MGMRCNDVPTVPQMDPTGTSQVLPLPEPQPTVPYTKDYMHRISESVRLQKKRSENEAYANRLAGLLGKVELIREYFRWIKRQRSAEAKAKQER